MLVCIEILLFLTKVIVMMLRIEPQTNLNIHGTIHTTSSKMRNSNKCKLDTLEKKSRFGEWLCRCAYECLECVQKTHKLITKGWPGYRTHVRGRCTFHFRKSFVSAQFQGHVHYALGRNAYTLCFKWRKTIFVSLFLKRGDGKIRKMAYVLIFLAHLPFINCSKDDGFRFFLGLWSF